MDQLNSVLDEHQVGRSVQLAELPIIEFLHVEDEEMIAAITREMLESQRLHVETCGRRDLCD